MPFSHPNWICS